VIAFFTTGYFRDYTKPDSSWQYLSPNVYGKWVFVLANLDRFSDASDREILEAMAQRKLKDPDAPVESLAAQLGTQGRAYYELLVNRDPKRTPELLKSLPQGILREFQALNLANQDLSKLKARLILFHGLDDNIIPYTESIALAQAAGKDQVSLYLIKGLAHVDVKAMGVSDKLKLWCGVDALLRERSRASPAKNP